MHAQEVILFLAVFVLAATLIVVLVAPKLRSGLRSGSGRGSQAGSEPASEPPSEDRARWSTPAVPATGGEGRAAVTGPGGAVSRGGEDARATSEVVTKGPTQTPTAPTGISRPFVRLVCPTCRRQFAAGLRYCPYDARVLAVDLHRVDGLVGSAAAAAPHAAEANQGKICPSCARRYDAGAVVCGRDGVALVSVN